MTRGSRCRVLLILLLQWDKSVSWSVPSLSPIRQVWGSIRQHSDHVEVASTDAAIDPSNHKLWEEIKTRFQGDFDNYNQVIQDRQEGMLPREGGGHENIHCSLVPLSDTTRLAAFYFDGVPQAIFRFRFYQLVPKQIESGFVVDTVLSTLNPLLEQELRRHAGSPMDWPGIFHQFEASDRVRLLPKCEVRWSWYRDPILHDYAVDDNGIHAVMVYGQAIVESQTSPGRQILILDQLSLFPDALYIHDRGFDPETGDFIYGNRRNVPYQLERVTDMRGQRRVVVKENLKWTLGPDYRSVQEHQSRIAAMGGPSNPRSNK